jgi:hypothetical protein
LRFSMHERKIALIATVAGLMCHSAFDQTGHAPVQASLALECIGKPFLSITARTKSRDTFPSVGLLLTDPLGRTKGIAAQGTGIPHSRYGEIVQIPSQPQRSRALAIEVCGAEQGAYEVVVTEQGGEPYVLDVTGTGNTQNSRSLQYRREAGHCQLVG